MIVSRRLLQVGHLRARAYNRTAELDQVFGQSLKRRLNARRRRAQRMLVDDQHAKIGKSNVARLGQRELIADAIPQFVRPRQNAQFEREIG